MHGKDTYCKKHGHDYYIIKREICPESVMYIHRKCLVCGRYDIIGVWYAEEEEAEEEE